MSRLTVPAYAAVVGMKLRRQLITSDEPHTILNIERPDADHIRIITNHGSWDFGVNENVSFPRRPDGSVRNWITEADAPTPLDLAIGDTLPPATIDPRKDPELSQLSHLDELVQTWEKSVQTVVSVYRKRPSVCTVTTHFSFPWAGIQRYTFADFQPVEFPYAGCAIVGRTPATLRPAPAHRKYRAHGPYWSRWSGFIFIAEHPTGVGRWPRVLHEGIPITDDCKIVRYEAGMFEIGKGAVISDSGSTLTFIGSNPFSRHPKDPYYGVATTAPTTTDDTRRLLEAYHEYMREGEKYPGDYEAERLRNERMG